MPQSTFVDAHCHLFNFVDIPVYETLDGKVSMNTAVKMLAAFSASGALLSGIVQHKIEDYKDFIQFFERPQEENIRSLAHEMASAHKAKQLVMTPLVMDFDCVRQDCGEKCTPCSRRKCPLPMEVPASVAQDPSAEMQLQRLQKAITAVDNANGFPAGKSVKVLPFLGFDLRKLSPVNSTALADLKVLWAKVGVSADDRAAGFENITNGKVLGIKLYPPIGFNPYPKDKKALQAYVEFYEWCIGEQIPITVHCQSGSYSAGRKQREVNKDTHASNWRRLFEDWQNGKIDSTADIKDLHINFAHFGGEQGLEDMFDPLRFDGIDEDSWTYDLVVLMRKFPHTYADISAFDWSDKGAVKNLSRLLEKDKQGKLGAGEYRVTDKLLWGSDIPMVVDGAAYRKNMEKHGEAKYKYLYANFKEGIFQAKSLDSAEKNSVITSMTSVAPKNFLLG